MTPSDDEVVARLRASFQATAARTAIGGGRLADLAVVPVAKHPRPLLATVSAAAAVVAVAATAAVVAQAGGRGHHIATAAGGGPSDTQSSTKCATLQNYYVVAPKSELRDLTYLLPSTPAGYTMYGAWGTIDRSMCPGTTTWYVEYDHANGYANTDNRAIQLMVTSADSLIVPTAGPVSDVPAAASATAAPGEASVSSEPVVPGAPVTVDGVPARFYDDKDTGLLVWTASGLRFQFNGPLDGDGSASLVALADSLVHVSVDDPRIKPPANCEVPAGEVCPG